MKPLKNEGFDIDVGVLLDCHIEDYDPVDLKKIVEECLQYSQRTVNISRSCITVTYMKDGKEDYHVDIPIYAKSKDNEQYHLAKGRPGLEKSKKFWEPSNPKELTKAFNNIYDDSEKRAQFRRCVRYLKRWRTLKSVNIHSIGLTSAAYHWLTPNKDDDLTALLGLVNKIISHFNLCRLSIKLPVQPENNLMEYLSYEDMKILRTKFETLRDNLQSSLDDPDEREASKTLINCFGEDFPLVELNENAKKMKENHIHRQVPQRR